MKKDAGKRSGLRRSAKKALVVKKKKTGMLGTSGPISSGMLGEYEFVGKAAGNQSELTAERKSWNYLLP